MNKNPESKIKALKAFLKDANLYDEANNLEHLILKISEESGFSVIKKGHRDRAAVKKIQRLLIKAGFKLPRHGADGIFGEETEKAVKLFLKEATKIGIYKGFLTSSIDKEALVALNYFAENPLIIGDLSEEQDYDFQIAGNDDSIPKLYLGDSQMRLNLGDALISLLGYGERIARSGKTASYFAGKGSVIKALKKKPTWIIVSLNGNGISGTQKLLDLIYKHSSASDLIWTGAPPPLFMKGKRTWAGYLKTEQGFDSAYKKRKDRNDQVSSMVSRYGTFVDPYDHIKYDEPMVLNGVSYESGYECHDKCDGIHLPMNVAKEYADKLMGFI